MDVALNDRLKKSANHFYLDGFFKEECEYMGLMEANGRHRLYSNAPVYIEPSHTIVGRMDLALNQEIAGINTCFRDISPVRKDLLEIFLRDETIDLHTKNNVMHNTEKLKFHNIAIEVYDRASEEERLVSASAAALAQWYNGHLAMDFGYVLCNGFEGVKADIIHYAKTSERKDFYQALLITVDAMQLYVKRHAEYAAALIGRDGYDDNRLRAIQTACENISVHPAGSFYEAVQLQWFLMTLSDYDSFGRYDQFMYPFYARDIKSGAITRDEAKDYVKDMMLRIDDNGSILNMTIGGIARDGSDAVNDLTYLLLEATRELGLKGPNLCLRLTKDSDDRLWRAAMDGIATGQSLPALYNDDTFIKMVLRSGATQADSNNYSLAGCSQAVIPYLSNFMCAVGLFTPAKMLDLALHDGFDVRIGRQVGPKTGDAAAFTSFEQVIDAYDAQMRYCVGKGIAFANLDIAARKKILSSVRTILMPECIEKGLGIYEGGCTYYAGHSQVVGLTNTADALIAIKHEVFDKETMTMRQLLEAIDNNFEGFEDIRAKLLGAPKFGNAMAEVDGMRARITRDIYREITSYPTEFGGTYWAGEVIFIFHMDQGRCVGALPDGRKAWTPLADSAGASQGCDINGLTSLLNSCATLPFDEFTYTSINVNLKFTKRMWNEQREKIASALKTYFGMGGCQLQINVVDKADLVAAMEHPDQYKTLTVRVGGFSAYFARLSKEQQLEIISRTESNC